MEICVRYKHSTKGKVKRIYSVLNVHRILVIEQSPPRLKSTNMTNNMVEIFFIVTLKRFKVERNLGICYL